MQLLTTAFYFVITLGVLVFVHEFGHFIAAKLCGMRVDRFSIGFPPRAFGKKIGETDYCVSWIPIGGYVKIAGMIDESFDTSYLSSEIQPWEFRAKPVWQRMIVISAGVLMNLLLAVGIFWGINFVQGKMVRETTEVGYVVGKSPADSAGIKPGDRILAVDGHRVKNWDDLLDEVYVSSMGSPAVLTVLRNGAEHALTIPKVTSTDLSQTPFGILPAHTSIVVTSVEGGLPADSIGLKPLDVLVSFNGVPLAYDMMVKEMVQENAGKPLHIMWKRGDSLMSATTIPTHEGRIGISFGARYDGPVTRLRYSLLQAFPQGVKDIIGVTVLSAEQLGRLVTGKVPFSQSVGGPIRIAQMATQYAEVGLPTYLSFLALLSISLALLNILPFPALDGGHLAFLVYEGVFRREVPVKIKLGLQKIGIALLLAFMAIVLYNDIVHF